LGRAEPSNTLGRVAHILLQFIYLPESFILHAILLFIKQYSHSSADYFPKIFGT
jgi:hypothetical protein